MFAGLEKVSAAYVRDNSAPSPPSRTIQSFQSFQSFPQNTLPRLQVVDASSPSKPENFRLSPSTPLPTFGASEITLLPDSGPDTKSEIQKILEDWSGRGPHVDFRSDEIVPLEQGRFLGHGSMGGVYETTIRGHAFAWKRRFCRRRIGDAERKEIEILKKVSHRHIIQLAGSYTYRQFLGLLLYPVAVCDLATLFEDYDSPYNGGPGTDLNPEQLDRCEQLGVPLSVTPSGVRIEHNNFLPPMMGCIVSAVQYLHSQKIRHKDLKPSNILLGQHGQLWLTDFGTATDFSLQTQSVTDNCERGTPKYFAPEVAAFKPNGRAADIFALGCILLEIFTLEMYGSLERLRAQRTVHDKSFQANLSQIHKWLDDGFSLGWPTTVIHLYKMFQRMLAWDPRQRSDINEVHYYLTFIDSFTEKTFYGRCCRDPFITGDKHREEIARLNRQHQREICDVKDELNKQNEDKILQLRERHAEEVYVLQEQISSLEASAARADPERVNYYPGMHTRWIPIPSQLVSFLKISEASWMSGARFFFAKDPHDDTGDRMLTITGTATAVEKALDLVCESVETEKMRRSSGPYEENFPERHRCGVAGCTAVFDRTRDLFRHVQESHHMLPFTLRVAQGDHKRCD